MKHSVLLKKRKLSEQTSSKWSELKKVEKVIVGRVYQSLLDLMNSNREVLRSMVMELMTNTDKSVDEIIRAQKVRVKKMFGLESHMKNAYLFLLEYETAGFTLKEIIYSIRSYSSEGK